MHSIHLPVLTTVLMVLSSTPALAQDLTGQQVDLTYNFGDASGSTSATVGPGAEFVLEGVPGTPGLSTGTIDITADTLTLTHNRGTRLGPGLPFVLDDSLVFSFPNLPGGSIESVTLTADPMPEWFGGLAFTGTSVTLTQLLTDAGVNTQLKVWTIGLAPPPPPISFDWVQVGDPGNSCDPQAAGCFGSVADDYQIAKFEVTNAQWVVFLNAKAASDPFNLYNPNSGPGFSGEIARSGSSGNYSYSVVPGREDKPANWISFYDVLRFINWMSNGQGSGDTETGSYTLLGGTAIPSNGLTVTRNPSATIFLPDRNEWYKAAYYDPGSQSYNPYPFADGFDGAVCETPPGTTTHSANCGASDAADVGAYPGSPSATGTLDQAANVAEWNETIVGTDRSTIGGRWFGASVEIAASFFGGNGNNAPANESFNGGFRVASPAPPALPVPSLSPIAAALLAALLLTGYWASVRRWC